ncbi:peptide deformylase [Lachnospiraceae bacterium]|nr:peptide deformylase [Lachnospiraceae bacterium]
MIKPIVKDVFFLRQKSEPTTENDTEVIKDLQDTLFANREGCVGMAANMIGYKKRTIIVSMGFMNLIMNNPVLVSKSGEYEAEEGCLSLLGTRKTTRYKEIEVEYEDINFKKQRQKFTGFTAQIVQHEVDHIEGIII